MKNESDKIEIKFMNKINNIDNDYLIYDDSENNNNKKTNDNNFKNEIIEKDDEDKKKIEKNDENKKKEKEKNDKNSNEFLGFEQIEMPKEEEINDFTVLSMPSGNSKTKGKGNIKLEELIIVNKKNKVQNKSGKLKSKILSLYYSKNDHKYKFDFWNSVQCYIFNNKIEDLKKKNFDNINNSDCFFLYMSYRSKFDNLLNVNLGNYTSDCGWGCMLRACQMMVSRGLIQMEIKSLKKGKKLTQADHQEIKKSILYLFYDNYVPLKEYNKHKYLNYLYEKYKDKNDEYEVIPPYSIHILSKLGGTCGEYTSDLQNIKCFKEISHQLFEKYFSFIHFESGGISKQKILETFCKKRDLTKDIKKNEYIMIYSMTNISEWNIELNVKTELETVNIFDYFGEEYNFEKGGLVFISLRLGLREVDKSFLNIIPLLFSSFRNNIGFVSGKKNKAYYFIGIEENNKDKNKLIFADPHLDQDANNKNITSYEIPKLFLMNPSDLSSSITLGIAISNEKDFIYLLKDLDLFSTNHNDIINFK